MPQHKYQVGQIVSIARSLVSNARGEYEITRLLSREAGSPKYLVKGSHEAHERVVGEHQLVPVMKPPIPSPLKVRRRKASRSKTTQS